MKILLLTDLHLTIGEEIYGRMPQQCLKQAVGHIRDHHADAELCVLMGDLTNHGGEDEYRLLQEHLRALPVPRRLMMGNHDDRASFRRVFTDAEGEQSDPVRECLDLGDHRLILLDTLAPGGSEGDLDAAQIEWLSSVLAAADRKCLIFLHHPPLRTFLPAFDAIGLKDRGVLSAVIAEHRGKIASLFFGHCHMSVSGTVAGVPAFGMRSLLSQMRPNFADGRFIGAPELPPAYGVVMATDDDLTVHVVEFGYEEAMIATGA
ncbi:MAG: metallophosphoesterase [Rhodospirillales bacterium]|nr:metallophosphoesterase [Rhodospirillales bacterium]